MNARRTVAQRQTEERQARERLSSLFAYMDPATESFDVGEDEQGYRTVYGKVLRRNRTGDDWTIALYVVRDGRIVNISGYAGAFIGWRVDRSDLAVHIGGGGMNMVFQAVSTLGRSLWPTVARSEFALRYEVMS